MRLRHGLGLAVVLCFAVISTLSEQNQDTLCKVGDLPTANVSSSVVNIDRDSFYATKYGDSSGSFYLQNKTTKPISSVAIALNYLGADEKSLVEMSYIARSDGSRQSFNPALHSEYTQELEQPIGPSERDRIQTVSDMAVPHCPTSARVVYVLLQFSDGSTFFWSFPGWQVLPIARLLPKRAWEFSPDLVRIPMDMLVIVRVDSSGHVARFVATDASLQRLAARLYKQASKWRFFPALADGQPVGSELAVLFRLFPTGTLPREGAPNIVSPLVVVRLVQGQTRSEGWTVWYARRLGGTELD